MYVPDHHLNLYDGQHLFPDPLASANPRCRIDISMTSTLSFGIAVTSGHELVYSLDSTRLTNQRFDLSQLTHTLLHPFDNEIQYSLGMQGPANYLLILYNK